MNRGVTMFEVLDGEVVVVSTLAIHPVIGGDHIVRIERGDDIIDYVFLRQPQLTCVHAVYVKPQRWVVHILRDEDLADAVHLSMRAARCCAMP